MKKITKFGAVIMMFSMALVVSAAGNTNGNKLQCFSGTTDLDIYGGTCTLSSDGTATLNNSGGDTDGEYSGVYLSNSNLDGKLLSEINKLSFTYTGEATAGSPRLTFPLDKDGDGVTDVYASVGAYYCNDGAGLVDVLNDPTCTIYLNDGSAGPWANWAELIAANPTWKVAKALPFIIADDAGTWTVSNVQLGKGPAKAAK